MYGPPLHDRPGRWHFQCVSKDKLVVTITVVVIFQEEVLVCAVAGKSDSRDAETGEEALESVETAEGAIVAPGLTLNN